MSPDYVVVRLDPAGPVVRSVDATHDGAASLWRALVKLDRPYLLCRVDPDAGVVTVLAAHHPADGPVKPTPKTLDAIIDSVRDFRKT